MATHNTYAPRNLELPEESLGALDIGLSREDIARIEKAVPASEVAGTRYAEPQMKQLDSEH